MLKIKEITQQNIILKLIEYIVRSNIYIFIFARFITNLIFTKFIFETDFKLLKFLNFKNINKNQKILDIGANDGISVKAIRNFIKHRQIISFEPDTTNFKKLKELKKKDKNLIILNYGLSNKEKKKTILFQPFFKKYSLSPFNSLKKKDVYYSIKNSLFINKIEKKIIIKKILIKLKKLDQFSLNPFFIKIDIQGHEYECIVGSIKTIKKSLPIIMLEYDKINNLKIFRLLKKLGYKKFIFRANKKILKEHLNEKAFNIFYIPISKLHYFNSGLKIQYIKC
jgi:FkbM family methyltransferase